MRLRSGDTDVSGHKAITGVVAVAFEVELLRYESSPIIRRGGGDAARGPVVASIMDGFLTQVPGARARAQFVVARVRRALATGLFLLYTK